MNDSKFIDKNISNLTVNDKKAIIIQKSWRSKLVRRNISLKNLAAIAIQRIIKGKLTRNKFKRQLITYRNIDNEEKQRKIILNRLKANERELAILKLLPPNDYKQFDKIKRNRSARRLQRFWKRKSKSNLLKLSVDKNINKKSDKQIDLQLSAEKLANEVISYTNNLKKSVNQSNKEAYKLNDINSSKSMDSFDINVLKMTQLQKRILDTAKEKQKDKIKDNNKPVNTLGMNTNTTKDIRGNRRERYEQILQLQQMSSIMTTEYINNQYLRDRKQIKRKETLDHVQQLINDLSSLPSLESNIFNNTDNQSININEWLDDIPDVATPSIINASQNHLLTVLSRSSMSDKKLNGNHRPWSLVASPYDTLLAPVDITTLNQIDKPTTHPPSGLSDAEESLWWVAYCNQAPALLSSGNQIDQWTDNFNQLDEEKKLLGQIDGKALLEKLSKDHIDSNYLMKNLNGHVVDEDKRINNLAKTYADEALRLRRANNDSKQQNDWNQQMLKKREDAATNIQKIARGKNDRKKTKFILAEKRVAMALMNLMNELSRPELRGGGIKDINSGPLFKLDSLLMNSLGRFITTDNNVNKSKDKTIVQSINNANLINKNNHSTENLVTSTNRKLSNQSTKKLMFQLDETVSEYNTVGSNKLFIETPQSFSNQIVEPSYTPVLSSNNNKFKANTYISTPSTGRYTTNSKIFLEDSFPSVSSTPTIKSPRNLDSKLRSSMSRSFDSTDNIINNDSTYIKTPIIASPKSNYNRPTSSSKPPIANNSIYSSSPKSYTISNDLLNEANKYSQDIEICINRVILKEGNDCKTLKIINTALSADISNFRKGPAFSYLRGLFLLLGGVSTVYNYLNIACHRINVQQSSRELAMELRTVVLLLAELGIEIGLLDNSRIFGTSEEALDSLTQMGLLFRLIAATSSLDDDKPMLSIDNVIKVFLDDIYLSDNSSSERQVRYPVLEFLSSARLNIALISREKRVSRNQIYQALVNHLNIKGGNNIVTDQQLLEIAMIITKETLNENNIEILKNQIYLSNPTNRKIEESLCIPLVDSPKAFQSKLKLLLQALPHLLGNILTAIDRQITNNQSINDVDIELVLWRSDLPITHSECRWLTYIVLTQPDITTGRIDKKYINREVDKIVNLFERIRKGELINVPFQSIKRKQ